MDPSIRNIGDRGQVLPARRDRRAKDDDRGDFQRELAELVDEDGSALRNDVVVPQPRAASRPIAPPTDDEVGLRVDVRA